MEATSRIEKRSLPNGRDPEFEQTERDFLGTLLTLRPSIKRKLAKGSLLLPGRGKEKLSPNGPELKSINSVSIYNF